MEDVIAQLKEASVGMDEAAITEALSACPTVPVDKVPALAAWIASLNA